MNASETDRLEYGFAHRRALILLSMAMVGTMATWFSMTAVLPELAAQWGMSAAAESLPTVMVQAGFVAGSLIFAFLNVPDRVSPPDLFFWSGCAAGLFTLLTAFTDRLTEALALRFLTGMSLAGVYGPGLKLAATWFRARRGEAMGIIIGALTIGSASPHLVRGMNTGSWELVLIVAGIASIAGSFIVKRFVPPGPYPPATGQFDPRAIPRLLRQRTVRLANIGYLGHMWELYAMWTWIGLYIAYSMAAGGRPSASSWPSLLAFIIIASGFVGAWLGGVLADRIGRERVVLASLAASGTMAAVIGFAYGNASWLLAVIGVIWGISIIADSAQFSAILTERVEARFVGTALTLQLALGFALTALIIMALPLFASLTGWKFAFWMLVPGPVVGIWSTYRLLKFSRTA